jgi:23S rRNA G2445 N2-methylase RlmL
MNFVARCIRGIEPILAAEIEGRLRADLVGTAHRTVEFRTTSLPTSSALRLGCADDVFLHLGQADGIDHTTKSLALLATVAARLNFDEAFETLERLRSGPLPSRFTVVASFLGRRNYNRYAIEGAVAGAIASATRLVYESSREGSPERPVLTFRVHLMNDGATVAIRLFDAPMHRRIYKQRSFEGTLHPPLAYAMAMLAGIRPGSRVLDPFCGAGTILIEAASLEPLANYRGSDIAGERISGASENARNAGANVELTIADAGRLPCEPESVDLVIANPPWGIGVDVEGTLAAEPSRFFGELARILRPAGRAVLLVHAKGLEPAALPERLRCLLRLPVSLFGQHPEIWVISSSAADVSLFDVSLPFGAELRDNIGSNEGG